MTMTKKEQAQFEARQETHAKNAAAILREDARRTPAEQAAIDELDKQRWVLWHAKDYSLGVIRLLSNGGLLRDKEHEKRRAEADKSWGAYAERKHTAERRAIGRYDELIQQAAERLTSGDDPAEVAAWLSATRDRISAAREKAQSAPEERPVAA